MIVGLIGALYWAVVFGPAYLDNISMREALDVAVHTRGGDEHVVEAVINRVNFGEHAFGYHYEENENGEQVEVRGMGLTADNISVDRNEQAHTLKVMIDYTRPVRLKPTSTVRSVTFHLEQEGPIPQ